MSAIVNYERVPLPEPAWYQKESNVKIAAITCIALGAIGIKASILAIVAGAVGSPFGGVALIAGGAVGLIASISLLAYGIFLLRKENWSDPAFVEKVAERAKTMTFDQIIEQYGWRRTSQFHFISKAELTEKFLKQAESKGYNYSQATGQYGSIFYHHTIDMKALRPLFMKEMGHKSFNEHGMHAIRVGVLEPTDPWVVARLAQAIKGMKYGDMVKTYGEMLPEKMVIEELTAQFNAMSYVDFSKHHGDQMSKVMELLPKETLKAKALLELRGKSYGEMTRDFKDLLTPEDFKRELERQYAESTFLDFYKRQGGSFYRIIEDKVIQASQFQAKAGVEFANMSLYETLQLMTWSGFISGVLKGSDFAQRFATEAADLSLSQIQARYGFPVIYWKITTKEFMHAKGAQETLGMSFDQIVQTLGWDVFNLGILSGEDLHIRAAFKQKAIGMHFCDLWQQYAKATSDFKLFGNDVITFLQQLGTTLQNAEADYSTQVAINQDNYNSTVRVEQQKADLTKAAAKAAVDRALDAYNAERRRYGYDVMTSRSTARRNYNYAVHAVEHSFLSLQYDAAVANYNAARQSANVIYAQNVEQANRSLAELNLQASIRLTTTREQVQTSFVQRLHAS